MAAAWAVASDAFQLAAVEQQLHHGGIYHWLVELDGIQFAAKHGIQPVGIAALQLGLGGWIQPHNLKRQTGKTGYLGNVCGAGQVGMRHQQKAAGARILFNCLGQRHKQAGAALGFQDHHGLLAVAQQAGRVAFCGDAVGEQVQAVGQVGPTPATHLGNATFCRVVQRTGTLQKAQTRFRLLPQRERVARPL